MAEDMNRNQIIFKGGGIASKIGTAAVAVGAITIAGVLIWRFWPREKDVTGAMETEVTPWQSNAAAGTAITITVDVTNIGEEVISPRLRFDIKKGTGGTTTVNENPDGFQPLGEIGPGETVTKDLSMVIPANWGVGSVIYGRLVCAGHEGTLWTGQVAVIVSASDYVHIIAANAAGLLNKCAAVGQTFSYRFTVRNSSDVQQNMVYTVGFRSQGFAEQYQEKDNIVTIDPGDNQITVSSLAAPSSESGHIMDFRVRQGSVSIYEGNDVAYIGPSQLQAYSNESFVLSMIPSDRKVSKSGQQVSFVLGFKHIGPAKNYKAGVYINDPYNTIDHKPYWITQSFSCPEDAAVTEREVTVTGPYRQTTLSPGSVVDCMMAFMEASVNPSVPKVDSQLIFANWDAIITIKA